VRAAVALGPALLAAAVFAPTLANPLVFDDPQALAMARAPFGELLGHRFGLTYLTIRLDDLLWGGWVPGLRLGNVLLHALASALAALVALDLTGRPRVALLAGALFAVHPVHVEAVASIENRKDVLAMIGVAASVLLWRRRGRPGLGLAGALAALALAMYAKDVAAAGAIALLPLAGLLPVPGDPEPARARLRWTLRRLVPLAAVGLATILWFGGNLLARFAPDRVFVTTAGQCADWGDVLRTTAAAVPDLARLLVFPAALSPDYPTPQGGAALGAALVAALVLAAALLARRAPVAAFALAWIVVAYLPVSNVVPLTRFFVAERYLYVPSFGLCLLVALGLARLPGRGALATATVVLLAAGALRSHARVRDWRDGVALWSAALRVFPEGTGRIHNELGIALWRAGRPAEAVPHLERAVALRPGRPETVNDLGLVLLTLGRAADAVPWFRRSLELFPQENPLVRLNLARALLAIGERAEAERHLAVVAREESWRDLPPAVQAAVAERGMSPVEIRARVRAWLARGGGAP
jgi:hypothetical protein